MIIIFLGIWCGIRKHTWSDIRGHSRDYMARRARRKGRMEKDGAIQLDDYDRGGQDAFSDEVSIHAPKQLMRNADRNPALPRRE